MDHDDVAINTPSPFMNSSFILIFSHFSSSFCFIVIYFHSLFFISSYSIMVDESEILVEPPSSVDEKSLNNALEFIEEMTKNTDSVQQRVLAEILAQNSETEYLKRFGLNGAIDRETFKSKVPVISYEDLLPDIQRIAKGDTSPILCAHPISEFLTRFSYYIFFYIVFQAYMLQ